MLRNGLYSFHSYRQGRWSGPLDVQLFVLRRKLLVFNKLILQRLNSFPYYCKQDCVIGHISLDVKLKLAMSNVTAANANLCIYV